MIVDPLLRSQMAASLFQLPQSLNWSSGIEWNIHIWNALRGHMKSMLHGRFRAEPAQLIPISEVRTTLKRRYTRQNWGLTFPSS